MAGVYNLEDLTFLFPVRLDSITRLENLQVVIEELLKKFKTNIMILEASKHNFRLLEKVLPHSTEILFVQDYDPIFHRTHYINQLVKQSRTQLVAVWDCDVLVQPTQIVESVKLLREAKADFVLPYKDHFLDTSAPIRELYIYSRDLDLLVNNKGKMENLYEDPVGGGFLANRTQYMASGLENENFYGWGREDGERVNRWKILGYQLVQIEGVMYHLTHERGINSKFHSSSQIDIKKDELEKLAKMSRAQMKEEVSSWCWIN